MPPAKRTTSKTTRTRAVARPSTDAEIAASEAARRVETEASTIDVAWVVVPLGGDEVRARPFRDWPMSVYRRVTNGDFAALSGFLHEDDEDVIFEHSVGEVLDWMNDLIEASGQEPGESRASRRSSRRTARR